MIDPALSVPVTAPENPGASDAAVAGADSAVDAELAALFAALLGVGLQVPADPAAVPPGTGLGTTPTDADAAGDPVVSGRPFDLPTLASTPATAPTATAQTGATDAPSGAVPAIDGASTSLPTGTPTVAGTAGDAVTAAPASPAAAAPVGTTVGETTLAGAVAAHAGTPLPDTAAAAMAAAVAAEAAGASPARGGESVTATTGNGTVTAAAAEPAREGSARARSGGDGRPGENSERPDAGADRMAGPNGVQLVNAEAAAATGGADATGGIDRERFDRLVEGLAARLRVSQQGEGARVRMHLTPRELGEVVVRLEIRDGVASAHLIAETADAGRLLSAAAADLRGALAERGVQVERLDVRVAGDSSSRSEAREGREGAHRQAPGDRTRGAEPAAAVAAVDRGTVVGSGDERGLSVLA